MGFSDLKLPAAITATRFAGIGRLVGWRHPKGRVESLSDQGGRAGHFVHANGKFGTRVEPWVDAEGLRVLFIVGTHPRNLHPHAVSWTFLDEAIVPSSVGDTSTFDRWRETELRRLETSGLARAVSAEWYRGLWTPPDAGPTDLVDPLLCKIVGEALCRSGTSIPDCLALAKALQEAPYTDAAAVLARSRSAAAFQPAAIARMQPALLPAAIELALLLEPSSVETLPVETLASIGPPEARLFRLPGFSRAVWLKLLEWSLAVEKVDPAALDLIPASICSGTEAHQLALRLMRAEKLATSAGDWLDGMLRKLGLPADPGAKWILCKPTARKRFVDYLPDTERAALRVLTLSEDELLDQLPRLEPDLRRGALARLAGTRALAVDLESDGQTIAQIGVSDGTKSELLYCADTREDGGADLTAALRALADRARGRLIVGHNFLAWDGPILARHHTPDPSERVRVWDTLLAAFVVEPAARTHALQGATHRASDDAHQAFDLFLDQLARLPGEVARAILEPESDATADPMELFCAAVANAQISCVTRAAPTWLQRAKTDCVLLPSTLLGAVRWVPGVRRLAEPGCVRRGVRVLEQSLFATPRPDPHLCALATVLETAGRHGVELLEEMLPAWLTEVESVRLALERNKTWPPSAVDTDRAAGRIHVVDLETWRKSAEIRQSLTARIKTVDPASFGDERQVEVQDLGSADVERIIGRGVGFQSGYALLDFRHSLSPELASALAGALDGRDWLEHRPLSVHARPGCRPWRQLRVIDESALPKPVVVKRKARRVRALGRHHGAGAASVGDLWPTTVDRRDYWEQAVQRLVGIVNQVEKDALVLFAVHDAEEVDCVCRVLNAAGLTLDRRSHWSRLRYAEAVSRAGRRVLVCHVTDVHDQLEVMATLGRPVVSVIEALPVEAWFRDAEPAAASEPHVEEAEQYDDDAEESAAAEPVERARASRVSEERARDERSAVPRVIGPGELLGELGNLSRRHLQPWLDSIVGEHDTELWLLDPRTAHLEDSRVDGLNFESVPMRDVPEPVRPVLDELFARRQAGDAPTNVESLAEVLRKQFDIDALRPEQEAPARAVMAHEADVLVTLPTGAGKSVLFQAPGIVRGECTGRLTLIISPLRALMRDQVAGLRDRGFGGLADYLAGDRPWFENEDVLQRVLDGSLLLLYVAPERLRSRRFIDVLHARAARDGGLEYVVFDEAHCVSHWGFEFRPDYLYAYRELARRRRQWQTGTETAPLLCFSATVTKAIRAELESLKAEVDRPLHALPEKVFAPVQAFIELDEEQVPQPLYVKEEGIDWSTRIGPVLRLAKECESARSRGDADSAMVIFVTRRRHAERLADLLSQQLPAGMRAAAFHAGLDATTRKSVYEDLRADKVHVLVATKAFGMGMDIPHLHWCVHLAPPRTLEDYLQEVGRIGRSGAARERAGLEKVQARLLHHSSDFAKNHEQAAASCVSRADIRTLWEVVQEHALPTDGSQVALVANDAVRGIEPGKVRKTLHWLEEMGRVALIGYLPSVLKAELDLAKLRRAAQGEDTTARVAKALAEGLQDAPVQAGVTDGPAMQSVPVSPAPAKGGFLDRLATLLSDFVGFVLAGSTPNRAAPQASPPAGRSKASAPTSDRVDAIVNLANVCRDAQLARPEEALDALVVLEADRCLKLDRSIKFTRQRAVDDAEFLWEWTERYRDHVLRLLQRKARVELSWDEIDAELWREHGEADPPEQPSEDASADDRATHEVALKKYEDEQARWQSLRRNARWAAERALRYGGVRMRPDFNHGETVVKVSLAGRNADNASERARRLCDLARKVAEKLSGIEPDYAAEISLAELLNLASDNGKLSATKQAVQLLSTLQLYSTEQQLLPFSYVLAVERAGEQIDDAEIPAELDRVNRLTVLRSHAMEVYTLLPKARRPAFVERYFEVDSPEALETLIDSEIGEIEAEEEEALTGALAEIRDRIRGTGWEKALDRHRAEPEQLAVIEAPYERNLLVNAGPGAGKTAVLLMRAAHMIHVQGLRPEQILVLAFNRAVVQEIRERLRELLGSLGYGAYARRLRASTFHSFALRALREAGMTIEAGKGPGAALEAFCSRLLGDSEFATHLVGDVKAILVDEFQDMNERLFQAVTDLQAGSRASVTAIGDDDQDILPWTRSDRTNALRFFREFRQHFTPEEIVLKRNFRSGAAIVEQSQKLLASLLNDADGRLKAGQTLVPHPNQGKGHAAEFDAGEVFEQELEKVVAAAVNNGKSLAVLCRTNAEAAARYTQLVRIAPGLRLLEAGSAFPVARARGMGMWLEICRQRLERKGDADLSDALWEELNADFSGSGIPEVRGFATEDFEPRYLWERVQSASGVTARLSEFVEFVDGLRSEDYWRMRGRDGQLGRMVVATIHKVKGLEFDFVSICPSTAEFPFAADAGRSNGSFGDKFVATSAMPAWAAACEEEARLFYVGMTRAKERLVFGDGPRERTWMKRPGKAGQQGAASQPRNGAVLSGQFEQVYISWPGGSGPRDVQRYLRDEVKVGDEVSFGGKSILHAGREIGRLSRKAEAPRDGGIVTAVIRYPALQSDPDGAPNQFYDRLSQATKKREWFYTVLVRAK